MSEQLENIKNSIEKIKNKDFGIYFFTLDTKGNPTAGVATIYEHVKKLRDLGYNAQILHDKNDYKLRGDEEGMGIAEWLGEEYATLPHTSIESQQLQVGPQDFVVIPEAFASVMKQTKDFPCKRVVFLQSYEYIFEMLEIGEGWEQFNIRDVMVDFPDPLGPTIAMFSPDSTRKLIFSKINLSIMYIVVFSIFKSSAEVNFESFIISLD